MDHRANKNAFCLYLYFANDIISLQHTSRCCSPASIWRLQVLASLPGLLEPWLVSSVDCRVLAYAPFVIVCPSHLNFRERLSVSSGVWRVWFLICWSEIVTGKCLRSMRWKNRIINACNLFISGLEMFHVTLLLRSTDSTLDLNIFVLVQVLMFRDLKVLFNMPCACFA